MLARERWRLASLHCRLTCQLSPAWFSKAAISPTPSMEHGPACWTTPWGISYAFSWTYAFLSSLSADQSLRYCGFFPGIRNRADRWASLMAPEYGYKEFEITSRPLVERALWAK